MKIATWVKSKDCWAYEKARDHAEIGWAKELNGSVIKANDPNPAREIPA